MSFNFYFFLKQIPPLRPEFIIIEYLLINPDLHRNKKKTIFRLCLYTRTVEHQFKFLWNLRDLEVLFKNIQKISRDFLNIF